MIRIDLADRTRDITFFKVALALPTMQLTAIHPSIVCNGVIPLLMGLQGSLLEPIPAVSGWGQGTPLDKLPGYITGGIFRFYWQLPFTSQWSKRTLFAVLWLKTHIETGACKRTLVRQHAQSRTPTLKQLNGIQPSLMSLFTPPSLSVTCQNVACENHCAKMHLNVLFHKRHRKAVVLVCLPKSMLLLPGVRWYTANGFAPGGEERNQTLLLCHLVSLQDRICMLWTVGVYLREADKLCVEYICMLEIAVCI